MADDNELINQADIEALLSGSSSQGASQEKPAGGQPPPEDSQGDSIDQAEVEKLLGGAANPSETVAQTPAEEIADADKLLGQDDIEKLLQDAGGSGGGGSPSSASTQQSPGHLAAGQLAAPADSEGNISQGDIEYLLGQAEKALQSVAEGGKEIPPDVAQFAFREFSGTPANTETATLDLLSDVELDLKIELGRTNMYLEEVLRLRKGAVVSLDKLAGDPVDIYVNGRLIARGEVLVLNDNFCVRVAELVAGASPVA